MTTSMRQQTGSLDARSTAARLMWIVLEGPEIDDEAAELLEAGAGGVVLFSRNITGAAQLTRLTAELRRAARPGLRVAIDHEGGHVARMGSPLTRFPSAMAVAAAGDEELARAVGRAAGEELASLGVDVNLAPVLDVALDPRNASVGVRSFGSSAETVARFGTATIRGYHDAGIAATAKHFPGHGRTPIDSHLALPTVGGGLEALRREDLPPFRAAIDAGVDIVMASHVAFDGLTDGLPSTLSPAIMRDLLRLQLGFAGLVVSDAMNMRALTDRHPIPEACVRAVAAGADVVMPLERQAETLAALEDAISFGALPAARLAEALGRIAELDSRIGEPAGRGRTDLPHAGHQELAREVSRRSLTLVHGAELLPIGADASVAVIEFASRRPSPVEEGPVGTATLGGSLGRHFRRVHEVVIGAADLAAGERAATDATAAAELVILATRDAYLWPEEQALVARIAASDRPTVLIALRNPYDITALARTTAAAAAYADVPATLDALADALAGHAGWPGVMPMALPA